MRTTDSTILILIDVLLISLVNGAEGHAVAMVTDGPSAAPSKRTGWLASLFGSAKPTTSSNLSQESEETSETDGAKKEEQAKKEEHITVPAKGKRLHSHNYSIFIG